MRCRPTLLLVLLLLACASSPEFPEDVATDLVLDAAAVPLPFLDEISAAGAGFHPRTASTFPFSLLLLSVPFGETEDLRRLRPTDAPPPTPRELWVEAGEGRVTLLPAGTISGIEVTTDGAFATGSFRFRRENLLEGRATFQAVHVDGAWRVTELALPTMETAVRLRADGTWELVEIR
jgi:hypothetical protein